MKADELGPDFILDPDLITLLWIKDRAPQPDARTQVFQVTDIYVTKSSQVLDLGASEFCHYSQTHV